MNLRDGIVASAGAERLLGSVRIAEFTRRTGRICKIAGLAVESQGPAARIGEICEIRSPERRAVTLAEVIGFSEGRVLLMPYGDLRGIALDAEVIATGMDLEAPAGPPLLGRVIDGFGMPLDERGPINVAARAVLYPEPLNPLERGAVVTGFETGVRAIDTFLPLARGQRIGIFAGAGVGKSTLLGMICRRMQCDVAVIGLIGERGREVRAFVDEGLSAEARARSVIVVATSDQPPLVRRRAAFLATAIAESFADAGLNVCLTLDSLTRIAMAQREIGLAAGELPTARGYTPSMFSMLPRLLERGGARANGGTLTALYTVLVEGDDFTEPVTDAVRAILDGHIILSRGIAQRGRYPAIDVPASVSRLSSAVLDAADAQVVREAGRLLAAYEESRDLIELGAYRAGSNKVTDQALRHYGTLEQFLAQRPSETSHRAEAFRRLSQILSGQVSAP
jgi:flagellum-specific ATP synthase